MSTTFNTLQDVSKKQRMLFLADSMESIFAPIAYSTSANLSFSADDVDVSNKMDGGWATSMQGKKSAEVSVDALCAYKQDLMGETELQADWNADKCYAFLYIMCDVWEQSDGSIKLRYNTGAPWYTGYMKLASIDLTSDNGDVAKLSVSGKSVGLVELHEPDTYFLIPTGVTLQSVDFNVYYLWNTYVGEIFKQPYLDDPDQFLVEITGVDKKIIEVLCDEGQIEINIHGGMPIGSIITIKDDEGATICNYPVTHYF